MTASLFEDMTRGLTALRDRIMQQMTQAFRRPAPAQKTADPRWKALGIVQAAMEALSLRDRDIAVLRGLLSFIPADRWDGPLVVFASNTALQARCDGIDERTLRRRLARLSEVGLIRRNQSPNRKRYVVRDHTGEALLIYGFDLAPLRDALGTLQEISEAHARLQKQIAALKAVLRDRLYRLSAQGFRPEAEDMIAAQYRLLRRKCTLTELSDAIAMVSLQLEPEVAVTAKAPEASQMTDRDGQTDRDIQSSNKEYLERKPDTPKLGKDHNPLPLAVYVEAAKTSMEFSQRKPRSWAEMAALARQLAPAIGVDPQQMLRTTDLLGERGASLAVLGLVEAYPRIKEPKRYLNTLLNRATTVGLDIERMFRSLTGWARFPAGNHGVQTL